MMYSLPAVVVLRAQKERILLVPGDVMFEGALLQKLGAQLPDDLVDHCAKNMVRIFGEDGQWYAEPLK